MELKPAYLDTLTALRGVAALGVILFHFDNMLSFTPLGAFVPPEQSGIAIKGYLWVDFFFLLSGFVLTHVYGAGLAGGLSRTRVLAYVVARFARIYPLHLFATGVQLLVFLALLLGWPALAEQLRPTHAWDDLLVHLLLGHAMGFTDGPSWNAPSWSIAAEWWTYLVALPLFGLVLGRRPLAAAALAALGACVLGMLVLLHPSRSLNISTDLGVLRCFGGFLLGMAIYRDFRDTPRVGLLGHDLSAIAALLLIGLLLHLALPDLLLLPAFCWLILAAAANTGWLRRLATTGPLRLLGDLSFAIYMLQGPWLSIFFGLTSHSGATAPEPGLPLRWFGLLLLAVLLSAWATHHAVELPARSWLRRVLLSATAPIAQPGNKRL